MFTTIYVVVEQAMEVGNRESKKARERVILGGDEDEDSEEEMDGPKTEDALG